MDSLIPWFRFAGALHLLILVANIFLPKQIQLRENLSRVSPFVRQVFLIHWFYILLVIAGVAALCLFAPAALTDGSLLGTGVSAFFALFWLTRAVVQTFYYDSSVKRTHPLISIGFTLVVLYLAGVFSLAALGGLR